MNINRVRKDALNTAIGDFFAEQGINIYEMPRDLKDHGPIVYGVNWSAKGTMMPEYSKEYAESILKAAEIAEYLNSLKLLVDWSVEEDPDITTDEQWHYLVELIELQFENGKYSNIRELLDGSYKLERRH